MFPGAHLDTPQGWDLGLGTLGVNLNLVSSLKLRLSFIFGRVGTLGGGGLETPGGGGQGWAMFNTIQCTQCSPVHTLIPRRAGT